MATSSGLFLATIYNQSQLAERKHVARYWSINTAATAVPLSAHLSPFVLTTKLAAAILGGGLFRGGVLPAQYCLCGRHTGDESFQAIVLITLLRTTKHTNHQHSRNLKTIYCNHKHKPKPTELGSPVRTARTILMVRSTAEYSSYGIHSYSSDSHDCSDVVCLVFS